MDINWDRYRGILKRAYFHENGIFYNESDMGKDFWSFFKKYMALAEKKKINSEPIPSQSSLNALGVPIAFSKHHRNTISINLDKTSRYSLREVPPAVVTEFEYILSAYITFCQKEKLCKLKKLRRSQRSLPIAAFRMQIVQAVRDNSVVLVAGDTGCGKSTQVPQYLLEAGFDQIACTQPRRIACVSLSKRVAYETLNEYGARVAYQIRFEKTRTAATKLVFLTEGLLLRQISADGDLSSYQVVILDEIHERHLHGDFLLGILKDLCARRPDLKLILMSATINLELFTGYFANAPVIQVPGRLYPIKLQYSPLSEKESKAERIDTGPYRRILQMIDEKYPSTERGDVLIFLSGITEITTVAESLKEYADQTSKWIILLLHSTLSLEEQDRVFDVAPEAVRKCILSTNIAETSVTIDGVRFVIDSGKVKEMRYDPATNIHQLKETWVSQASAEQRKGRAGRTGPGVCYRLYAQSEFEEFDKYSTSEIQRVSLESLVLQMYHLELPDPRKFQFIEPPSLASIEQAIDYLTDQGALTTDELLTPLGRMLVNLPVDVAAGKMLVMGCLFRQVEVVLTAAAALSVQSPFTNRSYRELECMELRKDLMSDQGDVFALLNVYREWLEVKKDGAESSRRWCRKRGIEEQRLYEITKLRTQFKEILENADLIERQELVMSGAQRRIRQGELKQLRELKRKHRDQQRKRKVLKFEHYDAKLSDSDDEQNERDGGRSKRETGDVHAVEFRIGHTDRDIEERLRQHTMDFSTCILIKIIVCSAFYPRYGLLDQHNNYKIGADQMLHCKSKPFTILHPNSCLAQDPEPMCVTQDVEGRSARHQLIFYSLLLETIKPYVVNSLRVLGLQFLLLLARRVDVSADYSRVVCDQFVEFTLRDKDQMESLLFQISNIRRALSECLARKLDGHRYHSDSLAKDIIKTMEIEFLYTMKRLLKADLQTLYVSDRPRQSANSATKFDEETGAIVIDGYMFLGSITSAAEAKEDGDEHLVTKWLCPTCSEEFYFNLPDRIEHRNLCDKRRPQAASDDAVKEEDLDDGTEVAVPTLDNKDNPLKRHYYCDDCQKQLLLTPTEILKHKRSHKS